MPGKEEAKRRKRNRYRDRRKRNRDSYYATKAHCQAPVPPSDKNKRDDVEELYDPFAIEQQRKTPLPSHSTSSGSSSKGSKQNKYKEEEDFWKLEASRQSRFQLLPLLNSIPISEDPHNSKKIVLPEVGEIDYEELAEFKRWKEQQKAKQSAPVTALPWQSDEVEGKVWNASSMSQQEIGGSHTGEASTDDDSYDRRMALAQMVGEIEKAKEMVQEGLEQLNCQQQELLMVNGEGRFPSTLTPQQEDMEQWLTRAQQQQLVKPDRMASGDVNMRHRMEILNVFIEQFIVLLSKNQGTAKILVEPVAMAQLQAIKTMLQSSGDMQEQEVLMLQGQIFQALSNINPNVMQHMIDTTADPQLQDDAIPRQELHQGPRHPAPIPSLLSIRTFKPKPKNCPGKPNSTTSNVTEQRTVQQDENAGSGPEDQGQQDDKAGLGSEDQGQQDDKAGLGPEDQGQQDDEAGLGPEDQGQQDDEAGLGPEDKVQDMDTEVVVVEDDDNDVLMLNKETNESLFDDISDDDMMINDVDSKMPSHKNKETNESMFDDISDDDMMINEVDSKMPSHKDKETNESLFDDISDDDFMIIEAKQTDYSKQSLISKETENNTHTESFKLLGSKQTKTDIKIQRGNLIESPKQTETIEQTVSNHNLEKLCAEDKQNIKKEREERKRKHSSSNMNTVDIDQSSKKVKLEVESVNTDQSNKKVKLESENVNKDSNEHVEWNSTDLTKQYHPHDILTSWPEDQREVLGKVQQMIKDMIVVKNPELTSIVFSQLQLGPCPRLKKKDVLLEGNVLASSVPQKFLYPVPEEVEFGQLFEAQHHGLIECPSQDNNTTCWFAANLTYCKLCEVDLVQGLQAFRHFNQTVTEEHSQESNQHYENYLKTFSRMGPKDFYEKYPRHKCPIFIHSTVDDGLSDALPNSTLDHYTALHIHRIGLATHFTCKLCKQKVKDGSVNMARQWIQHCCGSTHIMNFVSASQSQSYSSFVKQSSDLYIIPPSSVLDDNKEAIFMGLQKIVTSQQVNQPLPNDIGSQGQEKQSMSLHSSSVKTIHPCDSAATMPPVDLAGLPYDTWTLAEEKCIMDVYNSRVKESSQCLKCRKMGMINAVLFKEHWRMVHMAPQKVFKLVCPDCNERSYKASHTVKHLVRECKVGKMQMFEAVTFVNNKLKKFADPQCIVIGGNTGESIYPFYPTIKSFFVEKVSKDKALASQRTTVSQLQSYFRPTKKLTPGQQIAQHAMAAVEADVAAKRHKLDEMQKQIETTTVKPKVSLDKESRELLRQVSVSILHVLSEHETNMMERINTLNHDQDKVLLHIKQYAGKASLASCLQVIKVLMERSTEDLDTLSSIDLDGMLKKLESSSSGGIGQVIPMLQHLMQIRQAFQNFF